MGELVVSKSNFIAPATDLENAVQTYQMMADFVKSVLREGVDFGALPGVDRPTLLKPGAEKLLRFFGMYSGVELQEKVEDWTGKDHAGEPFFFYRYKAMAIRNGEVVAEGIGSCNNWEKKYRYRIAELVCPECGMPLRKSKFKDEYYCWENKGGCGATFDITDPAVANQPRGSMPNPNPADLVNTIDKMAQKRALVAVALVACNASEYFTQDIEDLDIVDSTYRVVAEQGQTPVTKAADKPAGKPQKPRRDNKTILQELGFEPDPMFDEAVISKTPLDKVQAKADVTTPKKYDFKTRPFDPETLVAALNKSAPTKNPATDQQMHLLAAMLGEYYQDETKTKRAKKYLFGVTSLKEADRQMVTAALDWLNLFKNSGGAYAIDEMAKKELAKIIEADAIASGQQSLLDG